MINCILQLNEFIKYLVIKTAGLFESKHHSFIFYPDSFYVGTFVLATSNATAAAPTACVVQLSRVSLQNSRCSDKGSYEEVLIPVLYLYIEESC